MTTQLLIIKKKLREQKLHRNTIIIEFHTNIEKHET